MRSRKFALAGVMVVSAGMAVGLAVGQTTPADPKPGAQPAAPAAQPGARQPRQPRAPKAPAADTKVVKKAAPMWGPWVLRERPNDIMVEVRVQVRSDNPKQKETFRDPFSGKTVQMPVVTPFEFEAVSMVWPYILHTAGSDLLGETRPWPEGDIGEVGYKGRFTVGDKIVDDEPTIVDSEYPSGARYATWQAPKEVLERARAGTAGVRDAGLVMQYPVRCYKVRYDEEAAASVGWPQSWPADAASTLHGRQMWIEKGADADGKVAEYPAQEMADVLKKYLDEEQIGDAKKVNPARLAKVLTGKVWRDVSPSLGTGIKASRRGTLEGIELQRPGETFQTGKGTTYDMVVALVALLRQAEIPTRLVLGVDGGSGGGGLGGSGANTTLRPWLEFALYDEANNTMCWVPVDILKLRKISNKPQKIDAKWRYFGSHDELDEVAPVSFHLSPPVEGVVTYGAPEVWGWMVFPKAPAFADSFVTFGTGGVPKKASKELKEVEPLVVAPVEVKK
ncbi:MAG: transglutaminase domain-containing protein [Phycisphaerales bacterium]